MEEHTEGALPSGAAPVAPVAPEIGRGMRRFRGDAGMRPDSGWRECVGVGLGGSARSAGPPVGDDALRHNRHDVTS